MSREKSRKAYLPHTDVALDGLVHSSNFLYFPPQFQLTQGSQTLAFLLSVCKLINSDLAGDGGSHKLVKSLVTEDLEHGLDVSLARAKMTREESVKWCEDRSRGWVE